MKLVALDNANAVESPERNTDISIDIHDRVTEAYLGKMGPQFMRETQRRIHWICGEVQGERVLDVGCSQGISAILLGREGKRVTGLDASHKSIEEATAYLQQEPASVRSNVSFINGDFLSHSFADAVFDTVIIAEVLEHLLQPENFVDAAAKQLPANGRLIVTVPFGINDFIDHKRTYYLLEPFRLLSRHFEVVDLVMLGKWLGLIGRRRASDEAVMPEISLGGELVERLEAAFLTLERGLVDGTTSLATRLTDANLKYRNATEQITLLKQRASQEELTRKQAEASLAELKQSIAQVEKSLDRTRIELSDMSTQREQDQANHRAALEQLEAERKALMGRLTEAHEKIRNSEDLACAEREQLAQFRQAQQVAEQAIASLTAQLSLAAQATAHLTTELAAAKQHVEAERQNGQSAVERLETALAAQRESRHTAEVNLARTEASREAIENALKDALEKQRAAAQDVNTVRGELSLAQASAHQRVEAAQKERIADVERLAVVIKAQDETHYETRIRLIRVETERRATETALNDATSRLHDAANQASTLREKLASVQSDSDAQQISVLTLGAKVIVAEQSAAQLVAQLSTAEQRLGTERQERRTEVERLEAALGLQRGLRHEAELKLTRFETEYASVSARLTEANQKYSAATDHLTSLKQRLQDVEASVLAYQLEDRKAVDALRQDEIASLNLQIQSLLAERAALQFCVEESTVSLQTESQRADEMAIALEAAQLARGESEQIAAALQKDLEVANGALSTQQGRFLDTKIRLDAEVDDALALALHFEAECTELNARFSQAEEIIRLRSERIDNLRSEIVALQAHQKATSKLAAEDQERLNAGDATVSNLNEQLGNAEREREVVIAQCAELDSRFSDIEAIVRSRDDRIDSLQSELAVARAHQQAASKLAAESQQMLNAGEATVKALSERVGNSEREREIAKAKLDHTSSELETSQALRRTDHHQNEQLKINLLQTSRSLADLKAGLETLRQQKIAAENRVVKTRAMLSFQLGYSLLHGFKSWRSFTQLPGQLLNLRREARSRKVTPVLLKTQTVTSAPHALWAPAATSNTMHKALAFAAPVGPEPWMNGTAQALQALKVACIMDEFTFSSYSPECNLLQLSVLHWQTELTAFRPELLFIESAWRGKDDQWGSKVGHMSEEVVGILAWCRQNKIPTVFWNKEDPVHFETFLSTAKMFDYVFTTDIDCIHRYKATLGHERVYLLPFACQPKSSNPIEKYERKDGFCFAGAYYLRYPERTRDLGNFMTALAQYRPVEIYDRNHGKEDPNYQFPPEYQPFIVGNLPFDQIDKAYKGYRYAINLNSIKQSQSMFARRVFDLLASNTITVSNFSRGVRLLFGDLVITTDSGSEIVRRLKALGDETQMRKFRLAGLRKVMMNHTYQDRLAYVVSKVTGKPYANLLPGVVVTAYAKNQQQFDSLLAGFNRQTYADRRILVVVPGGFTPELATPCENVQVLTSAAITDTSIGGLTRTNELVAGMVPDDYYGPNYLLDLALATRYSNAQGIGKVTHHVWSESVGLNLAFPGCQYLEAKTIPARCALVRSELVGHMSLREWVTGLYVFQVKATELLGVDEFNYCKNGSSTGCLAEHIGAVNDLIGLNQGIPIEELSGRSERIAPEEVARDAAPVLTGEQLATCFRLPANKGYNLTISGSEWEVDSTLADGKHEYLYAATELLAADLGFETHSKFYLDTTPGLNIQLVVIFLDAQKQRISHVIKSANRNHEAGTPPGTHWIRLGLRFYSSGAARIKGLVLGHRPLRPAEVMGVAEHLVLTNHYPSYDDLYRNGFVHSRVAAYAEHGVPVDVFRLRMGESLSHHEFHNVDVMTGSQEALHKLLTGGKYKSVLVHFLDEAMWEVLKHHETVKIVVWIHGAEIQSWHRRDFNDQPEEQRNVAKTKSEKRMTFWRELLQAIPANLKLIFVSRSFAEDVMEDLDFRIPETQYTIIHNPIDTILFSYTEKPIAHRKKILSIRPYASKIYANDLSVKAIQLLSSKPYFHDLEFRLIGDGKLFEETLAPLRKYKNVYIDQRFLTRKEIASLHKEYGIFLCPSRMDTQGVSRDEAMSSGLVPITNAVAAIPEFTDVECSILAKSEDAHGLAEAIAFLYENPGQYSKLSSNAAKRVRIQSAQKKIISLELNMFNI